MTTETLASIADTLSTVGAVVVVAALATLVVGLLERTHRRESGLGHAPYGADLGASAQRERVRDRDTLRVLDELRAAAGRETGSAQAGPAPTPAGPAHRRPTVRTALRSV
jgi:hypothetical protein